MVDSLFFCATLTGRREGHTPFVQAGAETSDTSAEVVNADPGSSWEGHSGEVCWCLELKCGVLWVVRPLCVPLMIRPLRRTYVVVRDADDLLCDEYKWVSRLRCRATALYGWVSAEWSRCPGSMTRRPRDSVAPL